METKDNNTTVGNQDTQNPSIQDGKPKMVIEITRYKGIVEAFNNPRSLAKLIVVIALIIVIVFGGITGIALVIKNYYPYKTINSNEYGATIIQNEDNEVIYWLFNSAELWANSGIHVKKGDVISVRASGAFHTAIHHLVEDADNNQMRDKWLNPVGGPNNSDPKDKSRSAFRISTTASFNKMLMQVIPDSVELKNDTGAWNPWNAPYIDGRARNGKTPDIYAIGSERDKITIRTDGVLYFTINDIALTDLIIKQMNSINKKDKNCLKIGRFPTPTLDDTENLIKSINGKDTYLGISGTLQQLKIQYEMMDSIKRSNDSIMRKEAAIQHNASVGDSIISKRNDSIRRSLNSIEKKYDSLNIKPLLEQLNQEYTELDYYLITNFVDAWFVDNAGSFLIVIERKKQQ